MATVMERTNVRLVEPDRIDPRPDFCVVDVSFISLRTIAPLLAHHRYRRLALLVKPHSRRDGRVGRRHRPRSRGAAGRRRGSRQRLTSTGSARGIVPPITGADGNVEYPPIDAAF
jgi:23S rRNA (cytidine1920-2'-O)/16S rRNA (cytidine1409-2'-O)-methyltransferase